MSLLHRHHANTLRPPRACVAPGQQRVAHALDEAGAPAQVVEGQAESVLDEACTDAPVGGGAATMHHFRHPASHAKAHAVGLQGQS